LRFFDLNFLEKWELKVINKIKDPTTTGLNYTTELIFDKAFNPSFHPLGSEYRSCDWFEIGFVFL
jgi:hypothetical protein